VKVPVVVPVVAGRDRGISLRAGRAIVESKMAFQKPPPAPFGVRVAGLQTSGISEETFGGATDECRPQHARETAFLVRPGSWGQHTEVGPTVPALARPPQPFRSRRRSRNPILTCPARVLTGFPALDAIDPRPRWRRKITDLIGKADIHRILCRNV
jgi:hypothetical protein